MTTANEAGGFEKLLGELEVLSKALPPEGDEDGDKKIAAAAADADGDGKDDLDGKDVDGEEKPLEKSMQVTLDDGTVVDAVDGTELVKALQGRLDTTEGSLLKALGLSVSLLKAQGAQIASLSAQVAKMSGEGRGRKAMVVVNERPAAGAPLQKSEDKGVTPEAFLAKALTAMRSGKLSGGDLSLAEGCINRGAPVPPSIVSVVLGE